MLKSNEMLEAIQKLEAEIDDEQQQLFANMFSANAELPMSQKFYDIQTILKSNPILVEPCLRWLHLTQAKLAHAQLEVLYTPEELEAMRAELEKGDS